MCIFAAVLPPILKHGLSIFFTGGGTLCLVVISAPTNEMQFQALENLSDVYPSLRRHPEEAMMVATHEGDLAAAQAAGMHTAHLSVPEEDKAGEGFAVASETHFDIVASDFDALGEKLNVSGIIGLGRGH